GEPVPIDDLLAMIYAHADRERSSRVGDAPARGVAVLIGDMQFGQSGPDGDPFEAIGNTPAATDLAAEEIERQGGADEVLVAWLGDHIEGFVSQGGKNSWRTRLTLTEQIRVTRRVMYYAIEVLEPLCRRLVMAAVPGNHGRVEAGNGTGTRADDNHDTDALVAVAEGWVWRVSGDGWRRSGKFTGWREVAFYGAPTAGADVLCCGHFHFFQASEDGQKLFIQVPTLGTDGAYWTNLHGSRPNPG